MIALCLLVLSSWLLQHRKLFARSTMDASVFSEKTQKLDEGPAACCDDQHCVYLLFCALQVAARLERIAAMDQAHASAIAELQVVTPLWTSDHCQSSAFKPAC